MLKDWLQLLHISSITLSNKRALIDHFKDPCRLFNTPRSNLLRFNLSVEGLNAIVSPSEQLKHRVQQDLARLHVIKANFLPFTDECFPPLLRQISSPPLGLFYLGDRTLLCSPQIAIVGSRKPSPNGVRTTTTLSKQLVEYGFTVTSGMAYGIDSAAHKGALSLSKNTIAVMGTGIDQVYPSANVDLYHELVKKALIVTEFLPGTPPRRMNFPERNRIISGLSMGVLVVEAGLQSGSLITARLAAEQGREVFAIPGSINMSTSHGCHFLIRNGAKLVELVEDILEELGQFMEDDLKHQNSLNPQGHDKKNLMGGVDKIDNSLYKLIDYTPISLDELIQSSNLTVQKVSAMLLELELAGLVEETPAGFLRLS